jgi:hypothetical protein
VRRHADLLKTRHFAEDEATRSTAQALRASSLRTALKMQIQLQSRKLRNASPASRRASLQGDMAGQKANSQREGVSDMARVIEFHRPAGFNPITKYVPSHERGAPIVFPPNLTRSASDPSTLPGEMPQEMMDLALFIWPPQELASGVQSHE